MGTTVAKVEYREPISGLDRALAFYESVADLAAARGKGMFPQHRRAISDLRSLLKDWAPDARWTIIGAVGVMEYLAPDHQRMTHDVDVVVEVDDIRAFIDRAPLEQYNFRPGRKYLSVYVELVHEPEGTPVQIMHPRLADLEGLFDRSRTAALPDGNVPIAAPEDLLILKTRSLGGATRSPGKRATDRADLIYLMADHPEASSDAQPHADENERAAIAHLEREAEIERRGEQWP